MFDNRTYLKGYYGKKNIGDDVFCVVGDWAADRIFKLKRVSVFGDHLPDLKYINGRRYSRRRFVPFLQVRFEILRSNNIIHIGGSTFNKAPATMLDEQRLFPLKNCYALGISIGPFKSKAGYDYVKQYLNGFKYVSLRDQKSLQYAEEMKLTCRVHKAFDVAALLPLIDQDTSFYAPAKNAQKNEFRKIIGVSVCNFEKFGYGNDMQNESKRANALVRLIRTLARVDRNAEFRFFIFNDNSFNGDRPLTNEIIDIIKGEVAVSTVDYSSDTLGFWHELKRCNLFLGFRLHSAILSYMAKIPFILFEYHTKCTDFLEHVGYREEYRLSQLLKQDDLEMQKKLEALLLTENFPLTSLPSEEATKIAYNDFVQCAEIINSK